MAGLMASKPIKKKKKLKGKEEVNGLRKPNERSSKPMRIIRGKEEVNGLGKPRK